MSRIRSKDTKIERDLRSALHHRGIRFGRKTSELPCKPDIILPKWKTVIFVHGCFWHRHEGCRLATTPKTNTESWLSKFATNVARDKRNKAALQDAGWRVLEIWGCEIEPDAGEAIADQIVELLRA